MTKKMMDRAAIITLADTSDTAVVRKVCTAIKNDDVRELWDIDLQTPALNALDTLKQDLHPEMYWALAACLQRMAKTDYDILQAAISGLQFCLKIDNVDVLHLAREHDVPLNLGISPQNEPLAEAIRDYNADRIRLEDVRTAATNT